MPVARPQPPPSRAAARGAARLSAALLLQLAEDVAETAGAAVAGRGLTAALGWLLRTAEELAESRRIAREGPPDEDVGLEPFAPPEVMPPAVGAVR